MNDKVSKIGSALRTAALAVGLGIGLAGAASAADIVVTIDKVAALDKIDPAGQADFFARVTIAGETFKTERIRRADVIEPNWVFRKKVPAGTHTVKVEIFDKDVLSKDDLIDINRVDGKRDLDFRVNTRTCRVIDFSQGFRCRDRIRRAGTEKRKAEVTFRVDVRR
jgi:hypothetical protein